MTGRIFNIQRFSVHDGPGIRTTVFFKGCPLRCAWCHNPESQSAGREIFFDPDRCIGCGACVPVCPEKKQSVAPRFFDRAGCLRCGACASACPVGALETCGQDATAEEVIKTVLRDRAFYGEDGGITLSGGEPLAQPAFALELLRRSREEKITTCIETSGYAPWETVAAFVPLVDLFLFDYKLTDSEKHRAYTGVANEGILSNLASLDRAGAKIVLRCPIVPGYNDDDGHFFGIADTANRLQNVLGIDLEPYHPLGKSKAARLSKDYLPGDLGFPEKETVRLWAEKIRAHTAVPVKADNGT